MDPFEIARGLKELLGEERIVTDEHVISDCSRDYIGFRQFERGDGKAWMPKAACVARPQSANDVSSLLAWLNSHGVDAVPRTGGSSVTMGVEPVEGGVIIDGSGMNKIISFNETDMLVTVQCGTALEQLENYLNKRGKTTGHFPQSLPMAQIGGLVATRSIGQFSTLYGGIEDLVVGLEAVLANGEIVRIKNVPRRSAGPDLRQIFIGSEGTLGFVTEITLKIFNWDPDNRWLGCFAVKGMKKGLEAFREIMAQGWRPAVARLHDPLEMERDFHNIAPEGHSIMLFIAEGPKAVADATGEGIKGILEKYDAVDLGRKPVQHWLIHRNDVCGRLDKFEYHKMGAIADTCEISALWSEIGNIYEAVLERLPKECPTLAAISGHSSHSYVQGTNIYFSFGALVRNAEEAQPIYMGIIKVIMEETLKRGGSIAHHHGSGKYRTAWMPQEHGSSYILIEKLKESLDPNRILNKGVLLKD
jgi:FAD/FMN-containing dehydrogenase